MMPKGAENAYGSKGGGVGKGKSEKGKKVPKPKTKGTKKGKAGY